MTMNKFWSFKNSANQTGIDQSELMLYGQIAERSWWDDEITPKQFAEDMAQCGTNDLLVRINSGGGDVFAAQAIHNMIKSYAGKVTVTIDGLCASAATIIACAGDTVIMPKNALYMIHNPSVTLWDMYDADELIKLSGYLTSVKQTIVNVYLDRSKYLEAEKIKGLMDDETWMTADEAKDYGFIDTVAGQVDDVVINKGFVVVNNVSCKYAAKNAAKIEKVLHESGGNAMPEDKHEKNILDSIKELLGMDMNPQVPAAPTADDAVKAERERIAALDVLKGNNAAVNQIIETAKKTGKTIEEIQPFVDALNDVPVPKNDALDAIKKLITDNQSSGSQHITGTGTPADSAAAAEVKRQKDLDEVINFANGKRGVK